MFIRDSIEGNKVRGTYNKAQYLEHRANMMQWWADFLEGNAVETSATVIEAKFG